MKIVITGATSFIGVHLIQECIRKQYCIYAVVRPNSLNMNRLPINELLNVIKLDMHEYDKIPQFINSADVFIHLTWEGVRAPYRDDINIQKKNYDCAVNSMLSAKKIGCTVFIGAGSQAEYGIMNENTNEDSLCYPYTEYGKKKLIVYHTLKDMAQKLSIRFIWPRIFSVYGNYDYHDTLIMSCISKMKKNLPVEMTACTQIWDFLHVEDASRAIIMLAECPNANGIFNIANGNSKPLREFVLDIKEVLESNSELKFGAIPYETSKPLDLCPNNSKIKHLVHWKPEINFKDGIRKII